MTCPCRLAWPLDYRGYDQTQVLLGLRLIQELGEWTTVTIEGGRSYRVSRHCIMLHGIKAAQIADYGLEEVEA